MSDVAAELRVQTLLPESRSASALSAHPPGRRDVFHAVAVAPSDVEGLSATLFCDLPAEGICVFCSFCDFSELADEFAPSKKCSVSVEKEKMSNH